MAGVLRDAMRMKLVAVNCQIVDHDPSDNSAQGDPGKHEHRYNIARPAPPGLTENCTNGRHDQQYGRPKIKNRKAKLPDIDVCKTGSGHPHTIDDIHPRYRRNLSGNTWPPYF